MKTSAAKKIKDEPASRAKPATAHTPLKIVIVGHVDHGKSTLVGRLLHDTGSLPEGKFEQIKASCIKRGMPFEWAFLMDALQAERNQGITIETTQIGFKTKTRDYVIIDAPGHKEFLKNMISGAASAEAALLIIDAKEGMKEQSRRHGYLLHLLGVRQIAVLVNKMDAVGYSQKTFDAVQKECRAYLKSIGVTPTYIIPVSAREGANIVSHGSWVMGQNQGPTTHDQRLDWYKGPTVLGALDRFTAAPSLTGLPLRFPVQDVYKFDERRIIVGRLESGSLKVGDEILVSPGDRLARVKSFEQWPAPAKKKKQASAGESIGITFEEQIFIERGHVVSHADKPPFLTNLFRASIFWLGHKPLAIGSHYTIKLGTAEFQAEVKAIEKIVDPSSLKVAAGKEVPRGGVAEIVLRTRGLVALDAHASHPRTGRFVLIEGYDICGGGIVSLEGIPNQRFKTPKVVSTNITAVDFHITPAQRALANGHTGGVIWLTGLSGSGKSTLALELQQQLFAKGCNVFVLDGDNVRAGLNRDLGFSHTDRSENIRRVGEVAALFAQAGTIVITSFISPYREDRRRARAAAPEYFHTVYVKSDVNTCEKRDKKGLYKQARAGKIKNFTGVSAPYEEPQNPDLIIDTAKFPVGESVALLVRYAQRQFIEPVTQSANKHFAGADI